MNRKGGLFLIVGLIILVAFAGGVYYAGTLGDSSDSESESEAETIITGEVVKENVVSGSILDGEWCSGDYAQEIYGLANQGNEVKIIEAKALGFKEYDGRTACHVYVKAEVNADGQVIVSKANVYSYAQAKDVDSLDAWILSETSMSGQVYNYDYYWNNGQCVEGNGCDLVNSAGY